MRVTRDRSTALTRLTGGAILLMAATVWPMAVFAADPVVETQDNAIVVFTVIVLLFGSMTAGLFFASPLRRRVSSAADAGSVAEAPVTDPFGVEFEVWRRAQGLFAPPPQPIATVVHATPASAPVPNPEPPLPVVARPSIQAQPAAAHHRPTATPWSTGRPQPDANWSPERRGAAPERAS